MKRVLFVCVENSCRSQMAEGFARRLAGSQIEIYSAGSKPSGKVNPRAIDMMGEVGVDLSRHRSTGLDSLPQGKFDVIVTMGCGDACPNVPADRREEWALPDPKDLPPEEFRKVRDEIGRRVQALLKKL